MSEQLRCRSAAGVVLIVDICQRLLVVVAHDEARGAFLDRPGRREAAIWHQRTVRINDIPISTIMRLSGLA